MADLTSNLAGIRSPNPFWLASGPPTNTARQAHRAFEAGWGGMVWKTIGDPIVNTASRYSALKLASGGLYGFNNIELISDRSPETNFRELAEVAKAWPDRAVIASLMVDTRERWHEFVRRAIDAGASGIELNFGCPHGMCERGMGSTVGQQPAVAEQITAWAVEASTLPVIVKLTPNVTDITAVSRAVRRSGAQAISLINTVSSVTQVNLDTWVPEPAVAGRSSHGGYCGPAVKPIALNLVQSCALDPGTALPLSGIGGVSGWRDAAEFISLGCSTVQVCTAVMQNGFRIVRGMIDGLSDYLDSKGLASVEELRGKALPALARWENLDLNYRRIARIDTATCIRCNLCHIACEDGAHQCIDLEPTADGRARPVIREEDCVGCNLCAIVCPVENCITMVDTERAGPPLSWSDYQAGLADGTLPPLAPKD